MNRQNQLFHRDRSTLTEMEKQGSLAGISGANPSPTGARIV